ncbi:hypothetical protein QBC32DRAFT_264170 [Pseudoneurospora amorphoporcata]|uniref:Uncharacterized protein n=1 Tax=Pseudoneurospora amorphoporcata TaxID=241081 RepID=A0AAN6NR80_9PEZI|nr:hypothetical protein QBC32DRAFT_264170 [Pseudoneurospora amorphoporcata]
MTDHDHDMDDLSLPIALRRTRRTGTGTAIKHPVGVPCTRETSPPIPPRTPRGNRKNRITKTVRVRGKTQFSPDSAAGLQLLEDELSLSTGLTPMVRRTSLQPPSPAPAAASGSAKCLYIHHSTSSRRPSDPLRLSSTPQPNTSNTDTAAALNSRISKRRSITIRRNASLTLSEEKMNRVYTERRKREKEAQEEIERLRAELREKDKAIERFQQYDDTVDLEVPVPVEVDREKRGLDRDQQPRSLETPSNPTFHTALDHRPHDPDSGSETEAFSLTTSQFSEAIRAQLDCSTPPPSGSRARYRRPFPTTTTAAVVVSSPPTTSPFAMGMNMVPVTGPSARTSLPITPCSNSSRHGDMESALSSRRTCTSNATTIHAHDLHHDHYEEPEATQTHSRASPSSSYYPPSSSASKLATLQASLVRTRRSLGAALEMVEKFQLYVESEQQLRGETLLLEREKREKRELLLAGVVRDVHVQGIMRGEVVRGVVRKAVERRDEMWRARLMALVGEGVVEGGLGEVVDSGVGVGVDEVEVEGGVEVEGRRELGMGKGKRKRGWEEEDEDGEGEGGDWDIQEQGGGDGESVDLGNSRLGHSGDDGTGSGSYDDGLEDMERRIMRMRARMMRKRRRRTSSGFGSEEEEEEEEPQEETDPDA